MLCRWFCRWFHRRHHREIERWRSHWANGLLVQTYRRVWCRKCHQTWTELVD